MNGFPVGFYSSVKRPSFDPVVLAYPFGEVPPQPARDLMHASLRRCDRTEVFRPVVGGDPIFMVNLLRDAPMDVKVHQLVSAQDLAQDGHLPPPAVAQSACGLVLSG